MEEPYDENHESAPKKRSLLDRLKKQEETPAGPPKDPTDLDFQGILEKELGIIKVYDYAINNSLDLIYQPKLMERYENELIYPLIGFNENHEITDGGRLFIREEFERLQVQDKVSQIITHAEETCAAQGIKSNVQKRIARFSIFFMAGPMVLYFILASIWPTQQQTILIVAFVLMCGGPQLLKSYFTNKWEKFKMSNDKQILEQKAENIADVRMFIQDIIDDVRDRLLSNKVALEKIQFILFSENYQNVRFIRNQGGQRGAPLRSVYQFEYPEGMRPITAQQYGKSGIPEDDENDFFIYLKNAVFNEEGELIEFQEDYPDENDYKLPEALLNASEFEAVDSPDVVIPEFDSYSDVHCSCGETVQLKLMKTSHSALHNDYEFYLIIGEKCPHCHKNPFILVNSPGNEVVPSGLKRIFE